MTKKSKKYDDEDFEDSEDAESDITESDFEDPDEMEVSELIWLSPSSSAQLNVKSAVD